MTRVRDTVRAPARSSAKDWRDNGVAAPRDTQAARADGSVRASAGGTARQRRLDECGWHRRKRHLDECGPIEAGPSYRSCTASPQRRRGVTVSSLVETICEL